MEAKKLNIKSCTPSDFTDKHGNVFYDVVVEGMKPGSKVKYSGKKGPLPTGEGEYEIHEQTDKNGNKFHKLKTPAPPFKGGFGGGGIKKEDPKKNASIVAQNALTNANLLLPHLGCPITEVEYFKLAETMMKWNYAMTEKYGS